MTIAKKFIPLVEEIRELETELTAEEEQPEQNEQSDQVLTNENNLPNGQSELNQTVIQQVPSTTSSNIQTLFPVSLYQQMGRTRGRNETIVIVIPSLESVQRAQLFIDRLTNRR